jgi:hypothetical protein
MNNAKFKLLFRRIISVTSARVFFRAPVPGINKHFTKLSLLYGTGKHFYCSVSGYKIGEFSGTFLCTVYYAVSRAALSTFLIVGLAKEKETLES